MATTKRRINLTVPAALDRALQRLALRDERSVATKALELLERAVDMEEDGALLTIAKTREAKKGALVRHADAWL